MNSTILQYGDPRRPQYVSAADWSALFGGQGDPSAPDLTNEPANAARDTFATIGQQAMSPDNLTSVNPVPDHNAPTRAKQKLVAALTAASAARQAGTAHPLAPGPDDPSIAANAAAMNPQPDVPPDPRAVALAKAMTAAQAPPTPPAQPSRPVTPTPVAGHGDGPPDVLSPADLMARASSIPTADASPVAATVPAQAPPAAAQDQGQAQMQHAPSGKPWERVNPDGSLKVEADGPWSRVNPDGSPKSAVDGAPEWNAGMQATDAAMFGMGPNLNAFIESHAPTWLGGLPSAPTYEQALADQQAKREAYAAQSPGTATVADLIGGAVPYAVGGEVLAAPKLLGEAASLGSRAARMAGVGASGQGLAGAVNGDGSPGSVIGSALGGAALGAGGEFTGSALGTLAGKGMGALADRAFNRTNGAGLTATAADKLAAALAAQGQTPSEALQKAAEIGTGGVLADSGQAARELTAKLAAQDAAVAPAIKSNLESRAEFLAPRINEVVDGALGPDFNATAKLAELKGVTSANGAKAYDAAFADPRPVTIEKPVGTALAAAMPGGVDAGTNPYLKSFAARLAKPGQNLESLHAMQGELEDKISTAVARGNANEARQLIGVRNSLLDAMEAGNPLYAEARKGYASDKAVEDAFTEGRKLLSTRAEGQAFDPDLLKAMYDGMSGPEKAAYKLGARKSVADVMGGARSDPAGLQTRLANDNGCAAGKLRGLFGDKAVDALQAELANQAEMRATNNLALSGSKTAMASRSGDFVPQAKPISEVGSHGLGGLFGGAIAGREAAEALGLPPLAGMAAGTGVGLLWNKGAVPLINAGREAAAQADRAALARALTGSSTDTLAEALAARQAMTLPNVAPVRKLSGALMTSGAQMPFVGQ